MMSSTGSAGSEVALVVRMNATLRFFGGRTVDDVYNPNPIENSEVNPPKAAIVLGW